MKFNLTRLTWAALLGCVLASSGAAQAQVTPLPTTIAGPGGQGQGLAAVGLEDPLNGFPRYYTDKNGLSLEQCLTPVNVAIGAVNPGGDLCGLTGLLGVDPITGLSNDGKTPVFPTMFPPELFYNRAVAVMKTINGGNTATIAIQVEGAFLPAAPAAGHQTAFARIRYNVTGGLVPGASYTVTHPFGKNVFVADASGALPRNQGVIDQGCLSPSCAGLFDQVLPTTNSGPFLIWDRTLPAPPAGYVGDPNVLHTITGSPFGINFFRIEGPNVGGPGINLVETNQWGIWGKVYVSGAQPPAIVTSRGSYTRTAGGSNFVNLFVQAETGSSLTAVMGATTLGTLREDLSTPGTFFGRFPVTVVAPGTQVTITATNAVGSSVAGATLVDDVIIESVAYDYTGVLTVKAHSTDEVGAPTLLANGTPGGAALGQVLPTVGLVRTTVGPPSQVKVVSSNGGVATALVDPNPGAGVVKTATTTVLTPASATVQLGGSVTLTATVTPNGAGTPTGQVNFKVGTTVIGTAFLTGNVATLTIAPTPVGSYSITASYAGDGAFAASTSAASTLSVTKASTTTGVTANLASVTVGTTVTLTATVARVGTSTAAITGTVTFFDGATSLGTGTLTNGVATLAVSAFGGGGARSITAVYGGDANFVGSTSAATTVTVNLATSTTVLQGGTNLTSNRTTILGVVLHGAQTLSATVTPTPAQASVTGTLSFVVVSSTASGVAVGSTVASTTTIGNARTTNVSWTPPAGNYAGTVTLRAVYSGSNAISGSDSGANLITVRIN